MDYWTPVFSKIVDSSIWHEPDHVVKVWITMLAKKDKDHVVRANAFMIGSWAKKTEAEVLDALKVLSSPDTKRIEPQPHDGRRIERVPDGWLILNGAIYQEAMEKAKRNLYQAEWQKEKRAEERAAGVRPKRKRNGSAPGDGLVRHGGDPGEVADMVTREMSENRREGEV